MYLGMSNIFTLSSGAYLSFLLSFSTLLLYLSFCSLHLFSQQPEDKRLCQKAEEFGVGAQGAKDPSFFCSDDFLLILAVCPTAFHAPGGVRSRRRSGSRRRR
ncbi:hypothetical protein LSTR_LSTR016236 [Laodelphax striatellus]|uniref:Uncharacterized protein n=1 Tax=Laodelphax striatellus TaxID=195883 RepID=A0A482WLA9_LAOST|nr:hypothetical protein LSTR_LSTR009373 [Laodelphax striatellus]RZF35732.1 hypothetical protein LSTR_LSTR016236 [Laodelphax striatellus]